MPKVVDWFFDWALEHRARHPHALLPTLESPEGEPFYEGWRSDFVHKGIHDQAVATEASKLLMAEPLKYPRDHFPRLCEIAVGIYKARNASASPSGSDTNGREAAAAASKDCPHCGGQGWAWVSRILTSYHESIPVHAATHCICRHGQWLHEQHSRKNPEVLRGMIRFADVLEGRSPWHAESREEIYANA